MSEKYLILIRHGESLGNIRGKKSGIHLSRSDNSPLTKNGVSQIKNIAQKIRQKIKNKNQAIIYSSPLLRTKQTAKILGQILGIKKINFENSLLDVNYGKLEGKKWQEMISLYQDWWVEFQKDRLKTPFPGGESYQDVKNRLFNFFQQKILNNNKKFNLIITHEGIIRTFLSFLDNRFFNRFIYQFDNGKISIICFKNNLFVPYLINSDELFFLKNNKKFFNLCLWYLNKKRNFFYLKPKKNFSEAQVVEIKENDKTILVKFIPKKFEADYQKENIIFAKNNLNLPTPKIIEEEKTSQGIYLIRNYLPEKIGKFYFKNKKFKRQLFQIWVDILKKIHQFKTDLLEKQNWERFINQWLKNDINILKKINYQHLDKIVSFYKENKKNALTKKLYFVHNDLSFYNFSLIKENNRLRLSGVWDFERAILGDNYWDLAVIFKICFYPKYIKDFYLLLKYYTNKPTNQILQKIHLYLLMNITGAITYRYQRKKSIKKEVKNLDFFVKKFLL